MKGKFGIVALLVSSITFAGPVSAPNNLSDTPIISGGGTVSGGGTCRAYQNDGTAINLSGGETLVFYGSGGIRYDWGWRSYPVSFGGYLSTKSNYSGTAYVRVKGYCPPSQWDIACAGSAIGLFARNTDSKSDFIAGAGAGGRNEFIRGNFLLMDGVEYELSAVSGGGWAVAGMGYFCSIWCPTDGCGGPCSSIPVYAADVNRGLWFSTWYVLGPTTPGFHGSKDAALGAASSISAFYNSYTKNYTSFSTSLTISGGGYYGQATPTLYVCQ